MAQVNATLRGTRTFGERAQALIVSFRQAAQRRAVYRRTLRELKALSVRELADLGLHPSIIEEVAREAAFGT